MEWLITSGILMPAGGLLIWTSRFFRARLERAVLADETGEYRPGTFILQESLINLLVNVGVLCLGGGYLIFIIQVADRWNIEWTPLRSVALMLGPLFVLIPVGLVLRSWLKRGLNKGRRAVSTDELMLKIEEAERYEQWSQAIDFCQQALKRDMKNPGLWARKAFFLLRAAGDAAEQPGSAEALGLAVEHCDQALAIAPNHKSALLNKAQGLAGFGQWNESLELCNRVLAQDEQEARAWFTKGVVLSELKDEAQSFACLKKAVSLGDARATIYMAQLVAPDQLRQEYFSGGDGSTLEQAVVIDVSGNPAADFLGISPEHAWLERFHPGLRVIEQRLQHHSDGAYDVLTVQSEAGEKKEFYFNVSSFFSTSGVNGRT